MGKIRIVIADDHGVLRAGLRALLNSQPDMQVCGEASNGEEAIALTSSIQPDVLLLDLKMPILGGHQAITRIKRAHEGVKILVLTMYDDEGYFRNVLRAGASGYVLKSAVDVELLSAIRSVYKGGMYLDPSLSHTVIDGFLAANANQIQRSSTESRVGSLSERESQVLKLLALGNTNREIGAKLFLSVKTVEGYKARISEKLGLRGRAALTSYALKKKLILPIDS